MPFSHVKFTSVHLWLFVALLSLGWAQDVSNNISTKGVNDPNQRSPWLRKIGYLRRRRESSSEVVSFCLAPPQPVNGEWQLDRLRCDNITDCLIPEGTALEPGSEMVYRCDRGYKIKGSTNVYCRAIGGWSPLPTCVEVKCNSLSSVSTAVTCSRHGKWLLNCDSPVPPATRAELSCRRGYAVDTSFITPRSEVVSCNSNGQWEPDPIICIPVCGLTVTQQQPFIQGGHHADVGDFPWHASLFVQKSSPSEKEFICGGTIIKTNLVLTAAHCIYDESTKTQQDPGKLFVITGNLFRVYDSPVHDPDIVRKAAVKNVFMSCNYYGLTGNYASDIALLELQEPFAFSRILLPACLDQSEYSGQILEFGAFGRVAGFGRTDTGKNSGILQTLTVPFVTNMKCRASSNAAQNEALISSDKFCAGYNNGSVLCEGDSGGGLVFEKNGLWYVMGIVSLGLGVNFDSGERTCDKYSYSLYTRVPTYMPWIKRVLFHVERNLPYPSCTLRP